MNAEEIEAIAEFRAETAEEVTALYTRSASHGRSLREKANGDCIFYDQRDGCTIYAVRPRQCRTWPFWECKVCPGSGQGDLIPAEEITRRLNVIRL